MALGNSPLPTSPTKETFIKKEFKKKSHRVLIGIQRRASGGSLLRPLVPPGQKDSLLEKRATHTPLLSPNLHVTTVSGPRKKTQLYMSTRTRARPLHPSLPPLARRLLYIYQRLGSLEQRSGRSPPLKSSG